MPLYTLVGTLLTALLGAAVAAGLFLKQIQKLRAKVKEKEDSIAQTSKLLIQKNIELFDQNVKQQKMLASKDDFIAIASHQLRTPATEIKWGLGELIKSVSPKETVLRAGLDRLYASSLKMEQLIESLLHFAAVEQGSVHLAVTPYEPDPLLRTAALRIEKDFNTPSISLALDLRFAGTFDSIDQASLEMAASNLIENAFHYTASPGTVSVRTKKANSGAFELEVEDNGIGISEEMRERIFVKFRRAPEAQARNEGGSGVGLYIVKTLVERAGGQVGFESAGQKGTVFHFSIPPRKSSNS